MANTFYVLAVLSALIAVTEWLVRNTVMRHAGTAILVILVTGLWLGSAVYTAVVATLFQVFSDR